jgi:hypothetical protein
MNRQESEETMKKLIGILCLMTILFVFCQKPSSNIQGAWKLVYQKITTPDTCIVNTFKRPQIKIFSKSYFAFGYQDSTGAVAGGGKYTHDGKKHVESILYFPDPNYINKRITFILEIKNDTLCQSGILDSTTNMHISEKYIRID